MGIPEARLTEKHVKMLSAYDWPGNIRELQHVIERAVILGRTPGADD
jgi:DNA-binding NtrC family response regulator